MDGLDFQGAGSLHLAFERLKRRLAEEGLFDEAKKKPLPPFPSHITLVTSPSGAAAHDFIRVARDRCPQTRISIFPASVQGANAAEELHEALAEINRQAGLQTEIIVLCRCGGSFEDLAAFNDERLAREIRRSAIPVVSAVGHEIDFTIADFAADLRAPTPSAAAEMLLPDNAALADQTAALTRRLRQAMDRLISAKEQSLAQAAGLLDAGQPVGHAGSRLRGGEKEQRCGHHSGGAGGAWRGRLRCCCARDGCAAPLLDILRVVAQIR
ncbi:MAG: exodeoxyribonuclease VII large subunit [Candidatus Electronema sp. VV]